MGITHIIRGSDHINNTFIQTNIGNTISHILYKSNWFIEFGHFPLCNDDKGKKLSKRTNSSRLEELHYLEYETLWSITLSLGTGQKPIITNNPEDYIKSFNLSNYSSCAQMFSPNLLNQINRKILNITFKPENYELFQLLSANVNNREEFHNMESKFKEFKLDEKFKSLVESKEYLEIYGICFGTKFGPRLEDLLNYINNHKNTTL